MHPTLHKKKKLAKIFLITLLSILFLFLTLICYWGLNYYTGNFHSVIDKQIYRSRQLDEKELAIYTKKYGIKTIINLRGIYANAPWYQIESHFTAENHINYISLHFSSHHLPTKDALKSLINILETSPKPLMIHCQGGADRTGMAAAFSVILFKKNPTLFEIKLQDSWIYNILMPSSIGYQVLPNYFEFLEKNHLSPSRESLNIWINSDATLKKHRGHFLFI